MFFRVPLLFPSAIAISRLNTVTTSRVDPPGPIAGGYDPDLREPYPFETTSNKKATTVTYLPRIRIPCQVETRSFEELRQVFQGDAPVTTTVFVTHNKDLLKLGLFSEGDANGGSCCGGSGKGGTRLKVNDRIDAIEKIGFPGQIIQKLKEPLYIYQILPGSWGMGPTGQDLQIIYTSMRPATQLG